jgi:RNA polymerase sigma-70 factor (ECF subfamily)
VCIESHSPVLFRLALRIVGDEAEAEDVLQETFLSAFKSIHDFDGRSSLGTWLYRIAHNAALMRVRAHRAAVSLDAGVERDGDDHEPLEIASLDESPDQALVEHESAQVLGDAIDELPSTLREVFVLREIDDQSTAETARKLGISAGAVKVRLHRARLALRKTLSAYFEERAPHPAQSLACAEALKFITDAAARGEAVDESLRLALGDYIAACEQCRLLLDPRHRSVMFYCGERENPIPERTRHQLYEHIHQLWAERSLPD